MVAFKVKYVVEKYARGHRYRYWQPKSHYVVGGMLLKCPFETVRLPSDETWIMKAIQLNEALEKWRENTEVKRRFNENTVGWLIAEFKKDQRFRDLADSTQKLYGYHFPLIEDVIGDVPIDKVSRQQARDIYNQFSSTKRKASQIVQIARPIFNFACDMEWIKQNPFESMRIKKAKPRRMIISAANIEAAKENAAELGLKSVAYAIQLGIDAGQRPGDIRLLPRTAYDGKWLRVEQSKTGAMVDIPIHKMPVLKSMLDKLDHASTLILHEERTGQPYSKDMLCRRVREVFAAAGLGSDVQFRDLRRTAVVRMAEAGSTIPEICAITGHSLTEATEILEVYLPRTRKMAENAADKVQKLRNKKT